MHWPDAGFLAVPETTADVQRLYDEDVEDLGYVMNVSRLWAQLPSAQDALFELLGQATKAGRLTLRQRGILVTACASTLGDSYCSLAWGKKLAGEADPELAGARPERARRSARPAGAGARDVGAPGHPRPQRDHARGRRRPAGRRVRRPPGVRDHPVRGVTSGLLDGQRRPGRAAGPRAGGDGSAARPRGGDLRSSGRQPAPGRASPTRVVPEAAQGRSQGRTSRFPDVREGLARRGFYP